MKLIESKSGQTLSRAINVLRVVASSQAGGMRLTDIAMATGLDKSTVHRITKYLLHEGMLSKPQGKNSYRLGPLLFELGLCALPKNNLTDLCYHDLHRLAEETEDTAFLLQRSGWDAVCVARSEGTYPIKTLTSGIGDRHPMGIGAGGMAMLAALDDLQVNDVLNTIQNRLPHYGLNSEMILSDIAVTRAQGFACNNEVGAKEVVAVGVPLRGPSQQVVGGLFVASFGQRMNDNRIMELGHHLQEVGERLDNKLANDLGASYMHD